jgi:mRNA interferase MazF
MSAKYFPEKGDIVYIDFDPSLGHEQGGRRPAVVLSKGLYNKNVGLCVVVPITSKTKSYIFEIILSNTKKIYGTVLCDHIKNIDWTKRDIEFVEQIDNATLVKILHKTKTLLE